MKRSAVWFLGLVTACATAGSPPVTAQAGDERVEMSEAECDRITTYFATEAARCAKGVGGGETAEDDLGKCEEQHPGDDLRVFECFEGKNVAGKALVACLKHDSEAWKLRGQYPKCFRFSQCHEPLTAYNTCAARCAEKADVDEPVAPIRVHCDQKEKSIDGQRNCLRFLAPGYARLFDQCIEEDGCLAIRAKDPSCFSDAVTDRMR